MGISAGILLGLIGALSALVALSTPTLKLIGFLACVALTGLMVQAARDRDRGRLSTGLLTWLCASGLAVLLLVVLLSHQATVDADPPVAGGPGPTTAPPGDGATTGSPPGDSSPPASGTTWLVDLEPVAEENGDVEAEDWTNKPVQVKGTSHDKSLSGDVHCYGGARQIDYALGGRYRTFQTSVGMTDDSPATAPLTFYVLADNKRVKTVADVKVGVPQNLELPVTGVSRLALGIEAKDCTADGWTVGTWIDPHLVA